MAKKAKSSPSAGIRGKFGKVHPMDLIVPLKPENTATRWRVDPPRIWQCAFDWNCKGDKQKRQELS